MNRLPAVDPVRGYPLSLLAALFLAFTGIFIRRLAVDFMVPVVPLALWRNLFTAGIMLVALALFRRERLFPGRRNIPFLLAYALLLTLFNLSWTLSIRLNGATVATVLIYTSTVFTLFLDRIFHDERITRAGLAAALIAVAGCALVADPAGAHAPAQRLLGPVVGVLSGLAFGLYSIVGREASRRGINSWTTITWIFGLSGILMLAADLVLAPAGLPGTGPALLPGVAPAGWYLLLLLAAGPTLLGYGFYTAALAHLPSSVVNLIATLEPVFTAFIAYWYLGERISSLQGAGALLIMLAVLTVRLSSRRRRRVASAL